MKLVYSLIVFSLIFSQTGDKYTVVNTFPHLKTSYTQGLILLDGKLIEGTGQLGESALLQIDIKTGKPLKNISLPAHLFGEGVTEFQGKIYQITWKSRIGFTYNAKTLEKESEFIYPTEGWGLTHNESELILSDGTSTIYFLDPYTMQEIRRIEVIQDGMPLQNINELEYINDEIFANVYTTNKIVKIDPYSGYVSSEIDFTNLYKKRNKKADVLNGIAYNKKTKHLYITGKYWDKLFEVKLH